MLRTFFMIVSLYLTAPFRVICGVQLNKFYGISGTVILLFTRFTSARRMLGSISTSLTSFTGLSNVNE